MSLFEPTITKIVAYDCDWKREELPSSEEDMQNFISDNLRYEFIDTNILAIKFAIIQGDDEPEETIWYLNPAYSKAREVNCKLASEIVPEIIFLPYNIEWLLQRYDEFHLKLMKENKSYLCDEDKYNLFTEFLQTQD